MTLDEYLDLWQNTYVGPTRAPATAECYAYALRHLSPAILAMEIDQVTPLHLQREINVLAATYSREAQLLYAALHSAFRRADQLGIVTRSPMDQVEKPAHEKREISVLTREEAVAYRREAESEQAGALLILMLCLGLRRNEARALRGCDLDERGILHIRHQLTRNGFQPLKSRSSRRDIPLPEGLRSFFKPGDRAFLAPCTENGLRRQHLAVLERIGVERCVTLHGLRHTCATLAMASGTQVSVIQHLLGHAHFQLTADTYVHVDLATVGICTDVIFGTLCHQKGGDGARLEIV